MRAELKRLHSPDVDNLSTFVPPVHNSFCFLLQAMIGPKDEVGEESFDIQVCTAKWLIEHHHPGTILLGRHYLITFEYNYEHLVKFISTFCLGVSGETWRDLAESLGQLGKWEFEGY